MSNTLQKQAHTRRFFGTAISISTFLTFSRGGTRVVMASLTHKSLHGAVCPALYSDYCPCLGELASSAGTKHRGCLSYTERHRLSQGEECISVARSARFPLFGICQGAHDVAELRETPVCAWQPGGLMPEACTSNTKSISIHAPIKLPLSSTHRHNGIRLWSQWRYVGISSPHTSQCFPQHQYSTQTPSNDMRLITSQDLPAAIPSGRR